MSGCEYIVRIYSVSITACFIARQLEGQRTRWNRRRLSGHQRATAVALRHQAAKARTPGPESSPERSSWASGAVDGRMGRYEPGRYHHAAPPLLQPLPSLSGRGQTTTSGFSWADQSSADQSLARSRARRAPLCAGRLAAAAAQRPQRRC
eukprot:scaffold21630_cov39-Phaeocystis_antarctica.AAC.1